MYPPGYVIPRKGTFARGKWSILARGQGHLINGAFQDRKRRGRVQKELNQGYWSSPKLESSSERWRDTEVLFLIHSPDHPPSPVRGSLFASCTDPLCVSQHSTRSTTTNLIAVAPRIIGAPYCSGPASCIPAHAAITILY